MLTEQKAAHPVSPFAKNSPRITFASSTLRRRLRHGAVPRPQDSGNRRRKLGKGFGGKTPNFANCLLGPCLPILLGLRSGLFRTRDLLKIELGQDRLPIEIRIESLRALEILLGQLSRPGIRRSQLEQSVVLALEHVSGVPQHPHVLRSFQRSLRARGKRTTLQNREGIQMRQWTQGKWMVRIGRGCRFHVAQVEIWIQALEERCRVPLHGCVGWPRLSCSIPKSNRAAIVRLGQFAWGES